MRNKKNRKNATVGEIEFPPFGTEGYVDKAFNDAPLLGATKPSKPQFLFMTPCDHCESSCSTLCHS